MSVSARNVFEGVVVAINTGLVNSEVRIDISSDVQIVATITVDSLKVLGLRVGSKVTAFIKAPSILLAAGNGDLAFSARNRLSGVVSSVKRGSVNSDVMIRLKNGHEVKAIVTNDAVTELDINIDAQVYVLFKASSVILGTSIYS